MDEDIIVEGIALSKGRLLIISKKRPVGDALALAIWAGFSLFLGLLFTLGLIGVLPVRDSAGNQVNNEPIVYLLMLPIIMTILLAFVLIFRMFQEMKQCEIYEKGILFPFKPLSDYISRKEPFVPFEEIEEVFLNNPTAGLSFAVRTRKGYLSGKKKENVWKGIAKHGSSWPMMVVLLRDGTVRIIPKEEFADQPGLVRTLERKVDVNRDEYYLSY
jgi:hypothetical protein